MIEFHFLPLGRVDAILIGCDGHWAFVDSGFRADGKQAVAYMRKLGIDALDLYIATHRHRNHVGGAPVIVQAMRPPIVMTADKRMEERLHGLCNSLAEREAMERTMFCRVKNGAGFNLGSAYIRRIGPAKLRDVSCGALSENYNSMILTVQHGERTALFTGDTSDAILSTCLQGSAEVYKQFHHNAKTSKALLKRIAPQHIVVCNSSNPSKAYQKDIAKVGAKLHVAAKQPVILFGDENGWRCSNG